MTGRRRDLTPDEASLWQDVARKARPLKKHQRPKRGPRSSDAPGGKGDETRSAAREEAPSPATLSPTGKGKGPAKIGGGPGAQGGVHWRDERRLRRGLLDIEARLDLHGMTQREAHKALKRFLHEARNEGKRRVLVITGKGSPSPRSGADKSFFEAGRGGGILREMLPRWSEEPEFSQMIADMRSAHPRHGGTGAFYLWLRRKHRPREGPKK